MPTSTATATKTRKTKDLVDERITLHVRFKTYDFFSPPLQNNNVKLPKYAWAEALFYMSPVDRLARLPRGNFLGFMGEISAR